MKALILGILLGAGGGAVGTRELLREAPAAKSYFAHHWDLDRTQLDDGGVSIELHVCGAASLPLGDGGTGVVDVGCSPCDKLTQPQRNTLSNMMNASEACLQ